MSQPSHKQELLAEEDRLWSELHGLVDAGNTVIVVEHEMSVIAGSDWMIEVRPGAGDEGGRIVVAGVPREIARLKKGRTAPYLEGYLRGA